MQNVIKLLQLSRLCDACRQIGKCVAIWRWMSPEVDTCRQMAMSVAVARYRCHKNLSTAMASTWREGSRRVATAVPKVVQQAHWSVRFVDRTFRWQDVLSKGCFINSLLVDRRFVECMLGRLIFLEWHFTDDII